MNGRFKMSDDFEIFYRRWFSLKRGYPERVFLCFHGIELHSGAFEFFASTVSQEGNEVYAVDYRGFGESKEENLERGDTSDFKRQLQDLVEVVDLVRQSQPSSKLIILGQGLGCAFALWLAANHPEKIDGLICSSPILTSKLRMSVFGSIRLMLLAYFSPRARFDFLKYWPKHIVNGEEYSVIMNDAFCAKTYGAGWLFKIRRHLVPESLMSATAVRMPVLLLHADNDLIALPEGIRKLHSALKSFDKQVQTFAGADHWLFQVLFTKQTLAFSPEQRRQVISAILNWAARFK
jgi:acylglycerol lipase